MGLDDHGAGLPEVGDAALQVLAFAQQAQPLQALLAVGNLWDIHDIQAPCPSDPPLAATMCHASNDSTAAMFKCHLAGKAMDSTNKGFDWVRCEVEGQQEGPLGEATCLN